MACKIACKQCSQTGLPVLFTRYAVAYNFDPTWQMLAALLKLRPSGQFKTQPGGVALQVANYNVRMLRAGYLYIRIESVCRRPEWMGYVVHPHGYLTRFDVQHPQDAVSLAACSPQEWGANRSLVWIKEPKEVTKLNFMFHPDAIDPDHLKNVIEKDLGKYMQSFDVAAWAKGSKSAPDTAIPTADVTNSPVAEFMALNDEAVRNALEPQLYGLMGSSAIERGWGDYEEARQPMPNAGFPLNRIETPVQVQQRDYAGAHGPRLQNMAKYLADNNGAIVACEDAIGIAQELGHHQAEAQMGYARWQVAQADGAAQGVTNEWVFQTAVAAKGLQKLAQKGALAQISSQRETRRAQMETRGVWHVETAAETIARQERDEKIANMAVDNEFNQYFDSDVAREITAKQHVEYQQLTQLLSRLGRDQSDWLRSSGLRRAIDRYSPEVAKVDQVGGGSALSLQFAQCLSGSETNDSGRQLLKGFDVFGDNVLSRVISFNNQAQKDALKRLFDEARAPVLTGFEPSTGIADELAQRLRLHAGHLNLGDKALAFMENKNLKPICEAAVLRKMAWPLHVASFMSVKIVQGLNGLPVVKAEAWLVKHLALMGATTLGNTAADYAKTLSQPSQDRARNAINKLQSATYKADAAPRANNARAGALAALFDLSLAVLKGYQLKDGPNGRSAAEMVGSLMQGVGSLADWKAKAYEETIFKGVTGTKLFTTPAMIETADQISVLAYKRLRLTALKFLGPAGAISMWWDWDDARTARARGDTAIELAQYASVAGTAFTVGASVAGYLSIEGALLVSPGAWSTVAAVLGLVGAVLVVGAIVTIWLLKKEDWVYWLIESPLNKEKRGKEPVHKNLQMTLEKLVNAQASTGFQAAQ